MKVVLAILASVLAAPILLVVAIALGPVILAVICALGFGLVVFVIANALTGGTVFGRSLESAGVRAKKHAETGPDERSLIVS